MDLTEAEDIKILRRGGKNTQNYTQKDLHDSDNHDGVNHSPRAKHLGIQSQVGLRKHRCEQS